MRGLLVLDDPLNEVTKNSLISLNSPEVLVFSYFCDHQMNFLYALFTFPGIYVTKVLHNCHLQASSITVIYNTVHICIFNFQ